MKSCTTTLRRLHSMILQHRATQLSALVVAVTTTLSHTLPLPAVPLLCAHQTLKSRIIMHVYYSMQSSHYYLYTTSMYMSIIIIISVSVLCKHSVSNDILFSARTSTVTPTLQYHSIMMWHYNHNFISLCLIN